MEFGIEYINPDYFKQNYTYNLTRSCYNIILTQQNPCSLIINNRSIEVESHSLIFYTSVTKIRVNEEESFSFHLVYFSELFYCITEKDISLIKRILTLGHPSEGYVKITISESYIEFSKFIVGELTQAKENIQNPMIRSLIHLIITQVFIYLFLKLSESQPTAIALNRLENNLLWKFQELINENVQHQKNVTFYAEHLKTTPKRLAAITKKGLSKTPKELIIDGLIKKAKQKLV